MQLSYIIQRLKNGTIQNISHDFWEDIDYVHHINASLNYIFSQMNSLGNWFFSNTKEEISDSSWNKIKVFRTRYGISKIWQVKWDWQPLVMSNVNFDLDNPEYNEEWEGDFHISWENEITTKQSYQKLEVIYARFAKWHDFNNLNDELDLPMGLVGVLEFLVYWPVFYEQGASLSNNYLAQAKEEFEKYAANIWFLTRQKWFTV